MAALETVRLDRIVARLLAPWQDRPVPGVTVGVARDGALAVHRSAGLASVELGVPIGADTTFRIASVSKQFTCAAILMLADEGRLSINADARTYLPDFPDVGATVTVAHLMHNTSGLRDMLEIMRLGGVDLAFPIRREDLIAGIERQRSLNFPPGSRFLYCNSGFLLLGLIVEQVSGQSLKAFLEARIFSRLGMTATRMVESTTEPVAHLATGYLPSGDGWTRAQHGFPIGGEGGLVSCVTDLALWDRNFFKQIVRTEGLETQTGFTGGATNFYARGLVVRDWRGVRVVEHGGLWPGYKTAFLRAPELEAAVIVISNNGAADPSALSEAVLDALLDGRPGVHPVVALPADLSAYAGRFLDPEAVATVDFSVKDGVLTGRTHGVPFGVLATADGRLTARRGAFAFTFHLSGDELHVDEDAGHSGVWHRVTPGEDLPQGLDGAYFNAEIGASWTISGAVLEGRGPITRVGPWRLEAVEGDVVRIVMPGVLFESWLDVLVLRDGGGRVTSLRANGGRARQLVWTRLS